MTEPRCVVCDLTLNDGSHFDTEGGDFAVHRFAVATPAPPPEAYALIKTLENLDGLETTNALLREVNNKTNDALVRAGFVTAQAFWECIDVLAAERDALKARACASCGGNPAAVLEKQRVMLDELTRRAQDAESQAAMLRESNKSLEKKVDWGGKAAVEITRLRDERDEVRRHLYNLLARIHGDGGHYTEEYGVDKAVADADEKIVARFATARENQAYVATYAAACPCLHDMPCDSRCTCVNPASSRGCDRCCTYGSPEQQRAKAASLSGFVSGAISDMQRAVIKQQETVIEIRTASLVAVENKLIDAQAKLAAAAADRDQMQDVYDAVMACFGGSNDKQRDQVRALLRCCAEVG